MCYYVITYNNIFYVIYILIYIYIYINYTHMYVYVGFWFSFFFFQDKIFTTHKEER